MKASQLSFERYYSDHSGVQYAVRYFAETHGERGREARIEIESIHSIEFPVSEIDWLIDALYRVKSEMKIRDSAANS